MLQLEVKLIAVVVSCQLQLPGLFFGIAWLNLRATWLLGRNLIHITEAVDLVSHLALEVFNLLPGSNNATHLVVWREVEAQGGLLHCMVRNRLPKHLTGCELLQFLVRVLLLGVVEVDLA